MFNAQRQQQHTQLELEQVSEQLLNAKEQNRLQQLEIERLSRLVRKQEAAAPLRQQQYQDERTATWVKKMQTVMVALTTGKRFADKPAPTEAERVQYTLKLVGSWLQQPDVDLSEDERQLAIGFAKMSLPTPDKTPVQKLVRPLNASQEQQLAILNSIMERRTRYEKQEDKLLADLQQLIMLPEQELQSAVVDHPALRTLVGQWIRVASRLQWLHTDSQL